eukprot:GHRR01012051.1.p2 GENE.GHRR01012051.1~~GHRR01012051.1.p2  ORF type:complete len:102 (+),score=16.18 GHRR01012051.1:549-854(+)
MFRSVPLRLYVFDGFAGEIHSSNKQPLDINNLLLRGSVLRKTDWVIGLALNVGNDSKIVQNMTKAPRKVGQGKTCLLGTIVQGINTRTCACHVIRESCFVG